jgi:DNA-binding SARP family transcriptional activator/predicted ATPase
MTAIVVTLLGGFHVTRDGVAIVHFRGDKVRALLAYLAVESDRPHPRTALAALFWPDQRDELALRNLSQSLIHLRKALGAELADALLVTDRATIAWRAAAADVDVVAFLHCARSGQPAELLAAAERYQGELLAGFGLAGCERFEEWLLLTRERLHLQALQVLEEIAEHALTTQHYGEAALLAQRQIALDPWRELAYRQLMRAQASTGDRAAALATFERCRQKLLTDLAVEPDPATIALAAQLRTPLHADVLLPASRSNIPTPLTTLLGREEELAEIDALLRGTTRLVTISGVGGVGKTRLALAAAGVLRDAFADGVWWVALAGVAAAADASMHAASAAAAVLVALGGQAGGRRPARADLGALLQDRHMLLVLDNTEHLPGVADLVDELLAAAARVAVLVTSRERLNVYGEVVLTLEGLPVANDSSGERSAAIQLFLERAGQYAPTVIDSDVLTSIGRLCRVLEGLPLGIELAAHWSSHFSSDEITAAVQSDLAFLSARDQHIPDRHRSLQAVFEYTWNLLSDRDRRVLARLAIFQGSFDRQAASMVAESSVSNLAILVDKSLLRRVGPGRYAMHELLRQFAAAKLAADPVEQAQVAVRHIHYYLGFVADRAERLARDDAQRAASELRGEIDNIRAAWQRADRTTGAAVAAAAYGTMLFVLQEGIGPEGSEWFAGAAARVTAESALGGKLFGMQARLLVPQARHAEALAVAQTALAQASVSDDRDTLMLANVTQAMALRRLGRSQEAQACFATAIALGQHSAPPSLVVADLLRLSYNWLCSIALSDDAYDAARHYAELNLAICRSERMLRGELFASSDLLDIAMAVGDYARARKHAEHAHKLSQTLDFAEGEAIVMHELSTLMRLAGQFSDAEALLERALTIVRRRSDRVREATMAASRCLLYLVSGHFAAARNWLERCLVILRAADLPAQEWSTALQHLALLEHLSGDSVQALGHAEQALTQVRALYGPTSQAHALLVLGRIAADSGELARARAAYAEALHTFARVHPLKSLVAEAGLAQVELLEAYTSQDSGFRIQDSGGTSLSVAVGSVAESADKVRSEQLRRALQHCEVVLAALATQPNAELDELIEIYLTCYRVLAAVSDTRAAEIYQVVQQIVARRAAAIRDEQWRMAYLDRWHSTET